MNWSWKIVDGCMLLELTPLPQGLASLEFRGRRVGKPADEHPAEREVRLQQVHGTRVDWAGEPGVLADCDGVRSDREGLFLVVRTADCLSVVLASPRHGIAVVHAGWRGLAGGILEEAVSTFPTPDDVTAVLGPAIGPCCFEVGPEVAQRFPETARHPGSRGRPHIDLPGDAGRRLTASGISPRQVIDAGVCTRCHQHVLYSHRGSGGDGRRCVTRASYGPA